MNRFDFWDDTLSSLLIDLYEAVLDAGKWHHLTKRLAEVFGGNAVLFAQDSRSPDSLILSASGFDPEFLTSYINYYSALNIWTPGVAVRPVGAIVTGDEIIERPKFEHTEWYNDWLRPQGLYHGAAGVLGNDDGVITEISILRPKTAGEMSSVGLGRMQQLIPHLRQAIRVHHEISQARSGLTATMAGFEQQATAALIADETGRIVYANPAAEKLMNGRPALEGRRPPSNPLQGIENRMRPAIAAAIRTASGSTVLIPRPGQRPLVASVTPLRGATAGLPLPNESALILIRDPDRAVTLDAGLLRTLFGFTPTEAGTIALLANGLSVEEIASRTHTGIETVRTHIKRSLAKSGTHRQAALVALVSRIALSARD